MQVTHIKDNIYQVELSGQEQAKVNLSAEQCNITNEFALDGIIADGFDCYDNPPDRKES